MSNITSVLTELQGLRGENLLTKALALLIREELAADRAHWVIPLLTDEAISLALQQVDIEQALKPEVGPSLGRVDLILRTADGNIAIEVKLDAVFQELQLERYAMSTVAQLCILVPAYRAPEIKAQLPDGRGGQRRIYICTWERLLERIPPFRAEECTVGLTGSVLRRAFLREEIRRFYDDYRRIFDRAALEKIQQSLNEGEPERQIASAFLDGIRRLREMQGLGRQLVSAELQYLGFDLSFDAKDSAPQGWVGFVNTKSYPLLSENAELSGWRLVLCRASKYNGTPSGQPVDELGLRPVEFRLDNRKIKGITRHSEADQDIFEVPDLLGSAEEEPEELWNRRISAVFGTITRSANS